jgi:hypothetical protein
MQREKRSHKHAWPETFCHSGQEDKQQNGIYNMKQDVNKMMCGGAAGKQSVIELMGQPRQRVPVGGVTGGEGPFNPLPGKTRFDIGVVGDVSVIVIADKLVTVHGPVHGKSYGCKQNTKEQRPVFLNPLNHKIFEPTING